MHMQCAKEKYLYASMYLFSQQLKRPYKKNVALVKIHINECKIVQEPFSTSVLQHLDLQTNECRRHLVCIAYTFTRVCDITNCALINFTFLLQTWREISKTLPSPMFVDE
jgi:exonuclease I